MKIRKWMGYLSPRWRAPQPCEACGRPFTCGAHIMGCWCMEIKLDEAARAGLRSRYRRCLCRPCLERLARAPEPGP